MSMAVVLKGAKRLFTEDQEVIIQIGKDKWTLAEEDGTLVVHLRTREHGGMAPHPRINIWERGSFDARRIRDKQRAQ